MVVARSGQTLAAWRVCLLTIRTLRWSRELPFADLGLCTSVSDLTFAQRQAYSRRR